MAFVHLHNHTDFSILDGATRVDDLVKRAVDLGMPAVALTDHGYMFGVPNFDLACRGYNTSQADFKQWSHDVECFTKGWELEEPAPDAPDALPHDRVHAQWEQDVAIWEQTKDVEAVKANKPAPLIKPIFGCEAYFITDDQIERGWNRFLERVHVLQRNLCVPCRTAYHREVVQEPHVPSGRDCQHHHRYRAAASVKESPRQVGPA